MQQHFFNTVNLSGDELKQAVANAESQEDSIYLIFLHTGKKYTASMITHLTEKAGRKWPLWSNRRAITNLKNAGKLLKTSDQKPGLYGRPEFMYQILKTA